MEYRHGLYLNLNFYFIKIVSPGLKFTCLIKLNFNFIMHYKY
jgi:hypothetical protein